MAYDSTQKLVSESYRQILPNPQKPSSNEIYTTCFLKEGEGEGKYKIREHFH